MKGLTFYTFGVKWELLPRSGASKGKAVLAIRDAHHAEQILRGLSANEKGRHRFRSFLHHSLGWRNLANLDDVRLFTCMAHELHKGTLVIETGVLISHAAPAGVRHSEPEVQQEDWVEFETAPPPEEPPEELQVSHATGSAMAENNRDLAASGTPLKEICTNKDCDVCNAHLAMMGT